MFKEMFSKISKFATAKEFIILVIFLLLVWGLMNYSDGKSMIKDGMENGVSDSSLNNPSRPLISNTIPAANVAVNAGYDYSSITNPAELLPTDTNSEWARLNPINKDNAAMPDLLQAGYHIGLDTIGQTLRNPNYQLRSDPIIPKADVGPWNKSTIEPDLGRVPLEVGAVV